MDIKNSPSHCHHHHHHHHHQHHHPKRISTVILRRTWSSQGFSGLTGQDARRGKEKRTLQLLVSVTFQRRVQGDMRLFCCVMFMVMCCRIYVFVLCVTEECCVAFAFLPQALLPSGYRDFLQYSLIKKLSLCIYIIHFIYQYISSNQNN